MVQKGSLKYKNLQLKSSDEKFTISYKLQVSTLIKTKGIPIKS